MAEVVILKGGGSGVSSDEVTVTKDKVLAGYTYVGADTNDEAGTGTMAVQSAISFSAAALSATSIRISWKNPSKGPWEGVFIQMSTSGYPGTSGGTRVYTGVGNNPVAGASNYVDIGGLEIGTAYYFTCTSYVNELGRLGLGVNVGWGSSHNVSAKTKGILLYNNGVECVPLTVDGVDYSSSNGHYKSTYIDLSWGNNHLLTQNAIAYNGYTYLCFDVTPLNMDKNYNRPSCDLAQMGSTGRTDRTLSAVSSINTRQVFKFDYSAIMSGSGVIKIYRLRWANPSWSGSYSGEYYLHKWWIE